MAGAHGRIGWFLVWAVVFCDIGTSVYYVPGILYKNTKDTAGVFIVMTLVAFALLCLKELEVARRFVEGGGVVTVSASAFSPIFGCIGGQFIMVDYFLTAAISAASGVYYIDSVFSLHGHIVEVTALVLLLLGVLNVVGIKESATVSAYLAVAALAVDLLVVGVAGIRNAGPTTTHIMHQFHEVSKLPMLDGLIGFSAAWLAFSGLESLSQVAPAMRDNYDTPRRAMLAVFVTVLITSPTLAFLSTASLDAHLKATETERFISELGAIWGGWPLKIAVVLTGSSLLLFAANTAIIGNYHVQMALARLNYIPRWIAAASFRFGTPHWAIAISVGVPIAVVWLSGGDMGILGDLYAFGLLGSFFLKNLGLDCIRHREGGRGPGFWIGLVTTSMVAVAWAVNLVYKPKATVFGVGVSGLGLLIGIATQRGWWRRLADVIPGVGEPEPAPAIDDGLQYWPLDKALGELGGKDGTVVLVAVRGLDLKVLGEARIRAKGFNTNRVYVIYIDEVPGMFYPAEMSPSPEGLTVLKAAQRQLQEWSLEPVLLWDMSKNAAATVAEAARGLDARIVIVGASRRTAIWQLLRGRFINDVRHQLPVEISLVVVH